jgi:hypothetical protein
MAKKGQKVRFIAGKYGGRKGWIDEDREAGQDTVPVIVNLGRKGEWETYVYTFSVELERLIAATTYAEAVIQQNPDLDCALTKVCRDFARCNIKKDLPGFTQIIKKKLEEGTKYLESKGNKALYRHIKFNHSNAMEG